jgi:hypothetical protein
LSETQQTQTPMSNSDTLRETLAGDRTTLPSPTTSAASSRIVLPPLMSPSQRGPQNSSNRATTPAHASPRQPAQRKCTKAVVGFRTHHVLQQLYGLGDLKSRVFRVGLDPALDGGQRDVVAHVVRQVDGAHRVAGAKAHRRVDVLRGGVAASDHRSGLHARTQRTHARTHTRTHGTTTGQQQVHGGRRQRQHSEGSQQHAARRTHTHAESERKLARPKKALACMR